MRCIVKNQHSPKGEFLFFFESLIHTFKPTKEALWGFGVCYGTEVLYEYLNQPFYQHSDQALRAAKLHVLVNFCERSHLIMCLTLHPTDRLFVQSEAAIAQFGHAPDMPLIEFYPNKQVRIDLLRDLRLYGKAQANMVAHNIDGKSFEGLTTLQRIQLDQDTFLLLEEFKPERF